MSANAVKTETLGNRLWPASQPSAALRAVLLVVAGAALLTLSAKVQVPFYPVPMTLQTLAVLLVGAVLGPRLGVAAVGLYLAQGLVGLPVFTNTPPMVAGPLYFFGPTGGFLAGFLVSAMIVGWAAERGHGRSVWRIGLAMLVADAAVLGFGALWLAYGAWLPNGAVGIGLDRAVAAGVAPFVLGEALKIALAALAVAGLWRIADRRAP